ncbi:uncharacterized membrane protein YidH (DUF202 family) [Agromyces terreus]|uniref:Uncharacterized membrane protein YidH (DUF202 family) n=1 Tax=Agromyces terreus TaxID=424795 RepID=A0A9X2H4R0_9MICO|nr:DUF202 domain-containing protein [Agromyces terreus]MCP2372498.1 uncharacterized membrane protein YidH (DUF202 family) [Agromyces terreus]
MTTVPPAALSRDPGMQPERTALAWSRTGLAIAVNAVLVLRDGLSSSQPALSTAGVALFVLAAVAVAHGAVRRRQLDARREIIPPSPVAMLGVAATVLLAAVAGIASILIEATR